MNYDIYHDRSNTNAEKYELREKLFGTSDLLPMWVADMDIATPDFILQAIKERLEHPIVGYEEFPSSAYEAQIEWIKKSHDFEIKKEWMLYSPSVVTSINLAIKTCTDLGDEVIVQPPVYFPFYSSITNNSRKILRNPLKCDEEGDYSFDFEDLKSKISSKTKLLLLCSPHNPVGRVWRREELMKLSEICLENDIKVFSDEIHSDLIFSGHKHTPFASLSEKARDISITALGVGKTFNLAGAATSTLFIPNEKMFMDFKKVYNSFHLAEGNLLGHVSFEKAYRDGREWLEGLLVHLDKNISMLEKMLKKHEDKISFKRSEGTYLLWLNCSKLELSDKNLREFFIKKAKLGLSPGTSFGKEGRQYMRMNIAVPSLVMEDAINRLDGALGGV